eukprot:g51463.t1
MYSKAKGAFVYRLGNSVPRSNKTEEKKNSKAKGAFVYRLGNSVPRSNKTEEKNINKTSEMHFSFAFVHTMHWARCFVFLSFTLSSSYWVRIQLCKHRLPLLALVPVLKLGEQPKHTSSKYPAC